MRIEIFRGSLADLASVGESAWNDRYCEEMRIDLFNLRFLADTAASGPEWMPVALYEGGRLVSFVIVLGLEANLRGRPTRLAYFSWRTTVPDRAWMGFKVCVEALERVRSRYELIACMVEDASAIRLFERWTRRVADLHGPFALARHYPMAAVLRSDVVRDLVLPALDRRLLHLSRRPRARAGFSISDVAPAEAEEAEAMLRRRRFDLEVVYSPKQVRGCLATPPHLRAAWIRRRGERVGVVQFLDLPMLGKRPIGCAAVERFWFRPGHFRPGMATFLVSMAREGKGLALTSLAAPAWRDRWTLISLGMLPDVTRPLQVCAWATNERAAGDLARVRTASLPFR